VPASLIRTLADLRGKRIVCDFAHLQALGEAALAAEDIASADVTWVPWRGSSTEAKRMVGPLEGGEADAIFLIDWNLGDFAAEGLALRRLSALFLDRIRASSCYWVTEDELAARSEVLARAARALGDWRYYLVNAGTIRRSFDVGAAFTAAYIDDFNRFDGTTFG